MSDCQNKEFVRFEQIHQAVWKPRKDFHSDAEVFDRSNLGISLDQSSRIFDLREKSIAEAGRLARRSKQLLR